MRHFIQRFVCSLVTSLLLAQAAAAENPTDFTVKAVGSNKSFKLTEAKGQYVALHFLLKTECPFCLRHTREYATNTAVSSGVVHIFLKPDAEADITRWTGKLGDAAQRLTIYRDPDATLAKQFSIPDGYQFHGQVVHYPALVLLDPQGKEVFRYVGKNNTDRYSVEQFEKKLAELRAAKP